MEEWAGSGGQLGFSSILRPRARVRKKSPWTGPERAGRRPCRVCQRGSPQWELRDGRLTPRRAISPLHRNPNRRTELDRRANTYVRTFGPSPRTLSRSRSGHAPCRACPPSVLPLAPSVSHLMTHPAGLPVPAGRSAHASGPSQGSVRAISASPLSSCARRQEELHQRALHAHAPAPGPIWSRSDPSVLHVRARGQRPLARLRPAHIAIHRG
ncbi:hypothetical protein C8Q77DRAFT_150604 [Trametes polyzona]|nr:hypothetical protein C8Q77DRAFT_150604 [Trametes polyzona]